MGSKYSLDIEVIGNAAKELAAISGGMGTIGKNAQMLSDAFDQNAKGVEQVSSKSELLLNVADRIKGTATSLIGFADSIIGASKEMTTAIVQDASEFQDSASAMQFAFGDDWERMLAKTKQEATKLTFTFKQTVDLASSLGRLKINPFGTTEEKLEIFKSRTGEMISALEVLQDAADASGRGTEALLFSVREAVSGDWKSIRDALDLPREMADKWKKEMDGVQSQQEKYNILVAKMAELIGGAGKTRSENYSKAIAQLPDLMQILRANVGAEGLKTISKGMWELVGALSAFVNNKEIIASLGGAFNLVAEAIAYALRMAAKFVTYLGEVIKAAPWLPKLAMGLALVATVMAVVLGLAMSLAGTFLALSVTIGAIGSQAVATFIVYFIPALTAIATVLGLIGLLVFAVGKNIDRAFGNSSVSTIEKIKLTFGALGELFESYDGITGKMSEETASNLKAAGIFEFVSDLFKIYHRVRTFLKSFMDTVGEIGDRLAPKIVPMLESLRDALFSFLDATGLASKEQKLAGSETKSWADAGVKLAEALITIVGFLADIITVGAKIVRVGIEFGGLKVAAATAAIYIGILAWASVGASVKMAAAFASANAPLLLMLASILLVISAVKELQAAWDDNSWQQIKNHFWGDEEAMSKRQKISTGDDYEKSIAEANRKAGITPAQTQTASSASAALAPSPASSNAAATAASNDKTAGAVDALGGKMDGITAAIAKQNPQFTAYLDSTEIAAKIAKGDDRIAGVQ
jgi:hypothetical protein